MACAKKAACKGGKAKKAACKGGKSKCGKSKCGNETHRPSLDNTRGGTQREGKK